MSLGLSVTAEVEATVTLAPLHWVLERNQLLCCLGCSDQVLGVGAISLSVLGE